MSQWIANAALQAVLQGVSLLAGRARGSGIALPDLPDLDLGIPLVGYCGLGFEEVGTARLSLTGCVLENPESLRLAGAPAWRRAGGGRLVLPLDLGEVALRARWEIRQLCRAFGAPEQGVAGNVRGHGELEVRLCAGPCEIAVDVAALRRSPRRFEIRWPDGHPPLASCTATCAEGQQDSVCRTVRNYLALANGSRRARSVLSRFLIHRSAVPKER